jgi:alkanesulfonate monooxygenase SsuD/methylene tetrahydromethanopterin reductase-like flavin-dependent oxidoreductase (luciferase family)
MRVGIVAIPSAPATGGATAVVERIIDFGRRVERLGFAGCWIVDAFARGQAMLDPLMVLSALAGVTERIELGTCVMQVPLRHPVELAHRAQSLHVLSGGRFRFGVGSGSTRHDFDAVQADYARRFKTLPESLAVMRRVWAGEPVYGPALSLWPGTEGGPPVFLGAWRSQRWIDIAAKQCQGWIASGIYAGLDELPIGVDMFRKAGGKRAILANIFTDLRRDPPPHPLLERAKVTLMGDKSSARDRLRRLQDIGFDDALLIVPFDAPAMLDEVRALQP